MGEGDGAVKIGPERNVRLGCVVGGVVVQVSATGVCRSDWHAWMGHDPVRLPQSRQGRGQSTRLVACSVEAVYTIAP